MSKNPCGLDYCPYEELIGEYASCTACSWAYNEKIILKAREKQVYTEPEKSGWKER